QITPVKHFPSRRVDYPAARPSKVSRRALGMTWSTARSPSTGTGPVAATGRGPSFPFSKDLTAPLTWRDSRARRPRGRPVLPSHPGGCPLRPLFDAGWRQRALQGDPAAVRALADAVLQPLYGFCLYRVGRNPHLCEEVV